MTNTLTSPNKKGTLNFTSTQTSALLQTHTCKHKSSHYLINTWPVTSSKTSLTIWEHINKVYSVFLQDPLNYLSEKSYALHHCKCFLLLFFVQKLFRRKFLQYWATVIQYIYKYCKWYGSSCNTDNVIPLRIQGVQSTGRCNTWQESNNSSHQNKSVKTVR